MLTIPSPFDCLFAQVGLPVCEIPETPFLITDFAGISLKTLAEMRSDDAVTVERFFDRIKKVSAHRFENDFRKALLARYRICQPPSPCDKRNATTEDTAASLSGLYIRVPCHSHSILSLERIKFAVTAGTGTTRITLAELVDGELNILWQADIDIAPGLNEIPNFPHIYTHGREERVFLLFWTDVGVTATQTTGFANSSCLCRCNGGGASVEIRGFDSVLNPLTSPTTESNGFIFTPVMTCTVWALICENATELADAWGHLLAYHILEYGRVSTKLNEFATIKLDIKKEISDAHLAEYKEAINHAAHAVATVNCSHCFCNSQPIQQQWYI